MNNVGTLMGNTAAEETHPLHGIIIFAFRFRDTVHWALFRRSWIQSTYLYLITEQGTGEQNALFQLAIETMLTSATTW